MPESKTPMGRLARSVEVVFRLKEKGASPVGWDWTWATIFSRTGSACARRAAARKRRVRIAGFGN